MHKEIAKFPDLVKQKVTNFSEIFSANKFRVRLTALFIIEEPMNVAHLSVLGLSGC